MNTVNRIPWTESEEDFDEESELLEELDFNKDSFVETEDPDDPEDFDEDELSVFEDDIFDESEVDLL